MKSKDSLDFIGLMIQVGMFFLVALTILQNYIGIEDNKTLMLWIFFPAIYMVLYGLVYFKKVDDIFLRRLTIINLILIGIYLFIFSRTPELDNLPLHPTFNIIFFYFYYIFAIIIFCVIPIISLLYVLFYNTFSKTNKAQ